AIARVYSPNILDTSTFDYRDHFRLDRLVSLERLAALDLARVVRGAGTLSIEIFTVADLEMQEIEIRGKAPGVGVPLRQLELPRGVRVGTVLRQGKLFIAGPEDSIEIGDRVALLGKRDELDVVKTLFETETPHRLGVVIAGGGETGFQLARLLEGPRHNVVLMESNRERCEYLASHLREVTV
ncbi:MAG: NAD-binding protein, partial [Clostridia bacterium]|nr:NAD-binding protein [Clostridia bacterium]